MTIGGFFIVLFVVIGLYGLFKKDDCTITEEDIDELIHELEEEKKNLKVADLLAKFEEVSGDELANDRMILS